MPEPSRPSPLVLPALIAAVAAISLAASLFKLAAPTHPVAMAGLRLLIAGVLLIPFLARALRRNTFTRTIRNAALLAGLAYGAHFGAWVSSLTLTSVAASVTLVTTTPILLAVVSLATGTDRPTRPLWLALGMATVGVALIGGYDGLMQPEALLGDLLAFLGAVAIAVYFLLSRRAGEALPVWAYQCVACLTGAALLLLGGLVAGIELAPASAESLGYIALSALLPQLVGHSLLTWALRYATPTQVAMAVVGEPAGATAVAWVWLGDSVAPWVVVGCVVTLAAVVLAARSQPRPAQACKTCYTPDDQGGPP